MEEAIVHWLRWIYFSLFAVFLTAWVIRVIGGWTVDQLFDSSVGRVRQGVREDDSLFTVEPV